MAGLRHPIYHDLGMVRCHRLVGYFVESAPETGAEAPHISLWADSRPVYAGEPLICPGCGLSIQNVHQDATSRELRYVANTGWAGWQAGDDLVHG